MNRQLALGLLAVNSAVVAGSAPKLGNPKLDALLHGIEQRYNRAHTLSIQFTENYVAGKRIRQTESGTLLLKKPGRMRWQYHQPPGKLFLSDGKHFYLYTPDTQRVERSAMRNSEDLHAPMAFLLGNLNFYKEFSGFSFRTEGVDQWITAEPNSATLPFSEAEFLVAPDFRIRRLRVTEDNLSVLDFVFENEVLNPPLDPKLFVFQMPQGAEFEDTSQ